MRWNAPVVALSGAVRYVDFSGNMGPLVQLSIDQAVKKYYSLER
jgi:hypothetical protein